jgi:hypothetical protein
MIRRLEIVAEHEEDASRQAHEDTDEQVGGEDGDDGNAEREEVLEPEGSMTSTIGVRNRRAVRTGPMGMPSSPSPNAAAVAVWPMA